MTAETKTVGAAPIRAAAAAVLLHDGQVLLVQRQAHLSAFPGYWSFPGGKVDEADRIEGEDRNAMLCRAMARECAEEIGYDLGGLVADHQVEDIAFIGDITTPNFAPVRFDTHFYRVNLRSRPSMTLDEGELASADWKPPAEWLSLWRRGRLLCAPPTLAVLQALIKDFHATDVHWFENDFDQEKRIVWVEPVGDLRQLLVRSNTIPPAQYTNSFAIFDARRAVTLVDPSPASDKELQRLRMVIKDWPVRAIMLTHHHPDHNERANRLARSLKVPLLCSEDTHARIRQREGATWFRGVTVEHIADGDEICRWQGEAVHAVAVPGHDAGQLAPLPESRAWCIVSDLIQGVGTVVVGGDEGDMQAYFASLQRIIDIDPAVVLPSHGMAMGSTWKLAETLRHRQAREQQVLTLHREGRDTDAMLKTIYGGSIPDFLMPLARINIESHLEKLQAEGRL